MASLSYLNWFWCTLALLAVMLIKDSVAMKCHHCLISAPWTCSPEDCLPDYTLCYSGIGLTHPVKGCISPGFAQYDFGVAEGCNDGVGAMEERKKKLREQYEFRRTRNPNDTDIMGKTADQYADEMWAEEKAEMGKTDEGYTVCLCSNDVKDLCNDDEFDKKMAERINSTSTEKTGKNAATATCQLMSTVMFIVLVSGFFWSR